MTESPPPRPDREDFGEASLGEAQSSNPPSDPEMIHGEEPEGRQERTLPSSDPDEELVRREEDAAAAEAGSIGGRVPDEALDEAERPLVEAGQGVAEGFEQAEEQLRDAAEHGESRDPILDAGKPEASRTDVEYGEPDHVRAGGNEAEGEEGG